MKKSRPPASEGLLAPPAAAADLSPLDLELLHQLSIDAASSKRRLARMLGVSAPAVSERIARLERIGAIRGYTIDVDWATLGYPMLVYMAITSVQGSAQEGVVEELMRLPEVRDVSVVTGSIDLLARILVRDTGHLRQLLVDRIWRIEGVQRTETMISIADVRRTDFTTQLIGSMVSVRAAENNGEQT